MPPFFNPIESSFAKALSRSQPSPHTPTHRTTCSPHPQNLPNIPHPFILRPTPDQLLKPQILPHSLPLRTSSSLDPKRRVLVGDNVVLVFRVHGLVLRGQENFVGEERRARKVFEEVGMPGGVEMQVRAGGVAGLCVGCEWLGRVGERREYHCCYWVCELEVGVKA